PTPAPLDREALQTLPVEERRARLQSLLREWLARAAGVPAAEVDLSCPLAELGLDSIRTAELAFRLELELGVVLSPVELLDGRSVAALVEAAAGRVGEGERAPSPSAEEVGDAPVTAGQRALWFLQRLAPDSAAYHVARAAELHGPVDLGALRRAFQALVDRHPALRTTFPEWDGAPVQRIAPAATVSFEEVDATGWTDTALDERLAAEAHRPFDLQHGPLFRAHVFTRSPERRVLLLVLHHAVTDLWSLAVLAGELAAEYEAARQGQPSALPRIAGAASAHIARAQQTLLAGAEGERLWSWWREALAGAPTALELPVDRPRPAVQRHRGASLAHRFAPDFGPKLEAFARSRGATPFMVLLAGLGALLHRYTGERELVVGSPSAGRDRAGLADAVGYFVNPVPLRLRPEPELSFDALVARTRETVLGALRHAALPFPVLVERLHPSRDPSRSPVFQVMFALQRAPTLEDALAAFALESPGGRFDLGGLVMEPRRVERRSAQVELAIVAAATREGFGAVLEYSADLFDAGTIERLARHWSRLVEAALDAPSLPLSALPLLDAPERRLLHDWSGQAPANAVGRTVPELFEEQVDRAPDAPAIDDGHVVLSYREVEARANRLAHHLLRRGLRPEAPVAVLVERSPDLPIAFLGILKAGATYLPIDPAMPDERLRWILQAAGAAVVVTRGALAGRCAGTGVEVVDLDVMAGALAELPSERPPARALPGSLAYVLYTSGSTGRPKGVAVEHRAACNLAGAQIRAFGVGPGDRVLQFSSCGFDVSIMDFLMALATGGTLCIAPREALLPGPELARLLRERGITVFALVPVVLSVLSPEELPALRTVITGGEICTEEMVNRWAPGRRLFNVYGPTEATGWCTLQPCEAGAPRRPSIGRAHDGHRAYVLDAEMAPVPVGVPGELYLGGAGLARGYAGRPDLTAERFVPDPFGGQPGARLYRTGDRVRWLADGTLDFLGRVDDQVKLRGYRVELGEIEAVLLEHPAVREAVVVLRSTGAGAEPRLVAYVTPASVDVAAVRAALAARVPAYMVPSAFVTLAALPLNASAKVDRRALPPPPAVDEPGLAAPLGEVEAIVAQVLAEVLGVSRVGAHANFFDDLGGSSLTVAKACALLGQRLGREIPVVTFFE
ncbi:MAG TPA: amino acid adenylation domain-containing protein, partial [Longimicrobium sp.]|nr:amino acid adenylation domain-containing protein [Longimicrobium sp.]